MKDIYLNNIVDITDPECIFIKEFDFEIRKYGALVYNYEYNSYQYIKSFSQIDYKKELLPDFIKIEDAGDLLRGVNMTVHYEFDPDTEEDEENLEIWKQLSQIELPVFRYDDDGEYMIDKYVNLYPSVSKHTIWFLSPESYQYIADVDLLLLDPIIKNLQIAQTLIRNYCVNPINYQYDRKELEEYVEPDFRAVRSSSKKVDENE